MHTSDKRPESPGLSAILEGLIKADVKFILVGGLAAVVQGAPLTTVDVDIVHERTDENVRKLLDYLASISAVYRRPDDRMIEPRLEDFTGTGHTLLQTRMGALDILAVIEDGNTYEDLYDHTIEVEFRGHTIRVLDIEKLTELKKGSTDPKDLQRVPVLEETLRQLKDK